MIPELKKVPFTTELLPKVQQVDCGDEVWEREVSDWIKAPPGCEGALNEIQHGNRVWLYDTVEDGVVGFGSLGDAVQIIPVTQERHDPGKCHHEARNREAVPRSTGGATE